MTSNTMKTGTTTVGLVCKDCVVLAADMRATAGYLIANKDTEKVVKITDKIAVTIAGSVSAIQMLQKYLTSELNLRSIQLHRDSSVKEAANLLRNWVYGMIRQPSMMQDISHFLVGGTDSSGTYLYEIFPDGTLTQISTYVTSGSGSSYALGVLETQYKESLTETEGVDLAIKCIDTAMQRDIASGNGVNVLVIDSNGVRKVATKKVNTHVQ